MIRINGVDYDSAVHEYSNTEYGMYHINDNTKYFEPQRSTDFEFIITDLDGLQDVGDESKTFENAQELLRLAVVSCNIPHFEIAPLEQRRGNSVTKFAGIPTFSAGSLKVRDWIGANTKSVLMSWQHLAYDVNTDKVGILSDYKKRCILQEMTPDRRVVREWTLYGCWVSGISEPEFDHTNSSDRTVDATIQYDVAKMNTAGLN